MNSRMRQGGCTGALYRRSAVLRSLFPIHETEHIPLTQERNDIVYTFTEFSNLRRRSITVQFPSSILSWICLLMHFIKYLLTCIFNRQIKYQLN
ncbi:hypothetical protein TB1_017247 [Malus domestica]